MQKNFTVTKHPPSFSHLQASFIEKEVDLAEIFFLFLH